MSKWQCNSCKTIYPDKRADGSPYVHACHPEVIKQRAEFDADGKLMKAEVRAPRAELRDENPRPGMFYRDGVLMASVPDPETPGRMLLKPCEYAIVSEGAGRIAVE